MKEIGGFLEWETYHGDEFHNNCVCLNSGRNCLRYLLKAKEIKSIWLPKLLCSAIVDICIEEKTKINYYSIDNNLHPLLPHKIQKESWIYFINYYGQYNESEIKRYAQQYPHIIVDNAEAFYAKPIEKIDTIYTCRKFFGVPDGGYLYVNDTSLIEMEQDRSYERLRFLMGRFEDTANEFYSEYQENEELIGKLPLRMMSKCTHNLLKGVDYKKVKHTREKNFEYLHERLKDINQLLVKPCEGPYMYPLLIKNGEWIRKQLQKEKIYIPILWPNVLLDLPDTSIEYQLAKNILPLPCDQRYTPVDMAYVANKIIEYKMEGEYL